MFEILKAGIENIKDIQTVSEIAWPAAFDDLLSDSQIRYMMEMMYSDNSLREQMERKKHLFFLAKQNVKFVGYMSIEIDCEKSNKTKIHKIYLLPEVQKFGLGKKLLATAIAEAKKQNNRALYLNVNKYNRRAIDFYVRNGFKRVKEEVIEIRNGFVMDDYVYEKTLQ